MRSRLQTKEEEEGEITGKGLERGVRTKTQEVGGSRETKGEGFKRRESNVFSLR